MKKIILILTVFCTGMAAQAQPTLYNTISGTVWRDNNSNNLRDAGEELVAGIVVAMLRASDDSLITTTITDVSGVYTLNNYFGAGTYYLSYVYPSAGFTIAASRVGSNNTINSAADPSTAGSNMVSTPSFTISTSANLSNTYGLGLQRIATTLTHWVTKAVTPTNWNETFKLPKSNNAIGTLSSATLLITNAAFHPTIGIENTNVGATYAQIDVGGRLTITPPTGGGATIITTTSAFHDQNLSASDGTIDFSGTGGTTWYNSYSYSQFTRVPTSAQLSVYRTSAAPDSISISAATTSTSTIIGSGNIQASVTTDVGAGIFITYTYTTNVTLPVKLVSFSAVKEGNTALIRWTASSPNHHNFTVERSADGRNFTPLNYVEGTENGSLASSYSFTDAAPLAGKNLYRLKMIENGGAPTYSAVATVNFGNAGALIAAYPNPAARFLTVENMTIGDHLTILSITGQVMTSTTVTAGKQILDITTLPAGSYLLQAHGKDGSNSSVRFTKQ